MFPIISSAKDLALQTAIKHGSTYEKMGMIPLVSNFKGALEFAGGVALTTISAISTVALSSLYLISRVFSSDKRSFDQLFLLIRHGRMNEASLAEKLKVTAFLSACLGIGGLHYMHQGLIQQVPLIGNLHYGYLLGEKLRGA
jgi:hypothetical protein